MDVNSLIKAFSTLDSGSPHTTDVDVAAPIQDAQVKTSLIVRLPIRSNNTVAATSSLNNTPLPPQASLLGLPQELKDQIFGYLTEDEERIILGWRFVEAWKRHYPKLSYHDCFTSAIALHSLSMTCKQMLNEFQPALLRATKTRWTFLVNNFDKEQLLFFSDHINYVLDPNETWLVGADTGDPQVTLRLQMDNNAVSSADRLRDLCLSTDPEDYDTMRQLQAAACSLGPVTEVATLYRPRTDASPKHVRSMTKGEAKRIEFTLQYLHYVFKPTREYTDPLLREQILRGDEFRALESRCFEPFLEAVKDMCDGEEVVAIGA